MTLDTPFFTVDFTRDRFLNASQPLSVLVRQREYQHDAIQLRFRDRGIRTRQARYRRGSPVVLRYGYRRNFETFVGHVHSSKMYQQPDGTKELMVFLVGPDERTNVPKQRTFTRIRPGDAVKRIATEHRLSYRGDVSIRVYAPDARWGLGAGAPAMPQLGRTDWNMMVHLAKDVGFTLDCHRTTVRFRKRDIVTNPRVPTWSLKGTPGRKLHSFDLALGSAPLAKNRRLVMGGVDDNGKPFYATDPRDADCCAEDDTPDFQEFFLDPATSIHAGRKALSGLSGLSRYYVQARIHVDGQPHLRSGETIQVTDADPELRGFWWVGNVDHELRGDVPGRPTRYLNRIDIGRESIQQTVCVDLPPPGSFSGKPVIVDPCDLPMSTMPVPDPTTVYTPVDDCAPLELPAKPCTCRRKPCPGSSRPLRTSVKVAPRYDVWTAGGRR